MKLLFALGLLLTSIPASCHTKNKAVMPLPNTTQTTFMLDGIHSVSPALEQYTKDRLFGDLWKRPDLSPRDRSLVTVSALIASGQVAHLGYHLNRAMHNGLTQKQASEAHTTGVLCGLAQCLLCIACCQRRI